MINVNILGSVSPYCKGKCNCPGYMIDIGDKKILLDCGFGISKELVFPSCLNGLSIVISHYHKDHYCDLFAIKYAIQCYRSINAFDSEVNLYLPKDGECRDYQFIVNECRDYFNIIPYDESCVISAGDITIDFYKTYHSRDNYSVRVRHQNKSVVYSGDMGYYDIAGYCEFCKNADLFICEATFLRNEGAGNHNHLHTNETAAIAAAADVKKLIITHMWPEHDKAEYLNEVKQYFANAFAAVEKDIYCCG